MLYSCATIGIPAHVLHHLEAKWSRNVVRHRIAADLVLSVLARERDPVAVEVRPVDLPHEIVGAHVRQDDGLHTGDPLLDVLDPA